MFYFLIYFMLNLFWTMHIYVINIIISLKDSDFCFRDTIIEFQLENIIIIKNENPFVRLHQHHSILSVPATPLSWRTIQIRSIILRIFEYQSWCPRYQLWCLSKLLRSFSPQTILSQYGFVIGIFILS